MATSESTAVAKRGAQDLTPQQQVKYILEKKKGEFAAALSGRIDPEAFIRVAYTTVTKSPDLLKVSEISLYMALLESASLGLMPNGVMGEAYIVPFGKEAQFIPGYRGLIKLARQSGIVRNITARSVWTDEQFDVEFGLSEKLVHRPDLDRDGYNDKDITHVYAVAHFHDGSSQFDVMSRAAVERIRAKSRAGRNGPWVSDWEAMALKTVIRRLFKMLPSSDVDLSRAMEADNRDFERESVELERRSSAAALERRLVAVGGDMLDIAPPEIVNTPQETSPAAEEERPAEVVEEVHEGAEGITPLAEKLAAVSTLAFDLRPAGGDASGPQRNRILEYVQTLYGERDADGERITSLANDPKLGKKQAGLLIGKLGDAVQLLPKEAQLPPAETPATTAEVDPDDLFGEG